MFWHKHKWKSVAVFHYDDTSFGHKDNGIPSTSVTQSCRCGKLRAETLFGVGHVSLEALQAQEEDLPSE